MSNINISLNGSISKGWLAKHLGVTFDRDYYFDLDKRYEVDQRSNEYAATALPDLDIYSSESNLGQYKYFSDSQVLVGGIQPNMILGMLIGADFIAHDDMDADISPTPLKDTDLENLPTPKSLLSHPLIKLFEDQIRQIQTESRLQPIPPFFWDASGRATLHGPLTTAQKFLGENIFIDLMMKPDKVLMVMDWITECFVFLARHFSEFCDLAITSVHVGECSGCMINSDMFEQYVLPYAARIAHALGPLRFHSCGPSTHLLEPMHKFPSLVALDLGGDTCMERVRSIFGKDFHVDIAPMPADFFADSPQPILTWANQIIEANVDGPLCINYHLEPNYKIEMVRALNEFVTSERKSELITTDH